MSVSVILATDWQTVQGVPCLSHMTVGIGSSSPFLSNSELDKLKRVDGKWMEQFFVKHFSFQESSTISSEYLLRRRKAKTLCKEPKSSVLLCLQTSPIPPTTTALVRQHTRVPLIMLVFFFHLLPSSAKLGNLFLPASSHV